MSFKYAKLSGRIKEKFKTQERFAEAMNMSPRSISLKLNNKREWKQNEIDKACELLEIQTSEIGEIFFCQHCSKLWTKISIKKTSTQQRLCAWRKINIEFHRIYGVQTIRYRIAGRMIHRLWIIKCFSYVD